MRSCCSASPGALWRLTGRSQLEAVLADGSRYAVERCDALVTNSLFSGNLATAQGGRDGGGIYNAGTLTVLRSRFNGNAGVREGGWHAMD